MPQQLGAYTILREIGRGGMGIVYLAREGAENGRLVALKVLPTAWTNDPVRIKRFQREAECVKKVRHANIVPIYEVGSDRGMRYIAMKYIEGISLDVLIREQSGAGLVPEEATVLVRKRGRTAKSALEIPAEVDVDPADAPPVIKPLSEPQWIFRAVRIVEKIARALAHLHEHGIVHRDVKPGNILMDQFGGAWLADFGLVRDADASSMSHMDGILGTVQYIAPEQIEGDRTRIDHRSDLYSLGVTLYELVTLRRPFDGRDPTSTLYAVAREAPEPPRKLNPKVPEDLERVILKAMAKDPDARYQTGNAFADDLRRVRTFEPVRAARTPPLRGLRRMCARNPVLSAAAVALILCFMALLYYCVRSELQERERLIECRTDGDEAFEAQRFGDAADSYRLFLGLGGDDSGVRERLRQCQELTGQGGMEPR